ncbi:hypothetical protein HQ393_10400 [Chitinibacter bivalviorum]|uniref:Uncharacterized protein n=1 Tax=Chitinibacter bivalviorum TaxID=2739434 RepID=A0A7H9BML4_9NEIS|nr:hypothetical protein [Chitinibacter bivalviorum]QLG88614.1 hypothetical protein HQ393_10400 [Chitinibacter bivalviorum]
MPSTTHAHTQQSPFAFNPLPETHPLAAALPRMVESYDLEGQKQTRDLFNQYTMGCAEGNLAYLVAANAAEGDPAELVLRCRDAILSRLFGDNQSKGSLTPEQERIRAYIIGLMGDLENAFTPPESEVSE